MWNKSFITFGLPLLAAAAPYANVTYSNSKSALRILFQNNFNVTDDANHVSFLVLDAMPESEAAASCASLGESLIASDVVNAHHDDIERRLAYLSYVKDFADTQSFWIKNGFASVSLARVAGRAAAGLYPRTLVVKPLENQANATASYPVICTQSSTSNSDVARSAPQTVSIPANDNTYVGFRNVKAFSFQGIRYAAQPKRWTYSSVYAPKGETFQATAYGAKCTAAEDCLFLNIQTPYIPKVGTPGRLRPVLFWIHGGGFTGGAGSEGYDGSNLASKEDLVVVTINYRLSTLGFLSVPNTTVTGNYGIADQVTALEVCTSTL